jgi:hypothetical protein
MVKIVPALPLNIGMESPVLALLLKFYKMASVLVLPLKSVKEMIVSILLVIAAKIIVRALKIKF